MKAVILAGGSGTRLWPLSRKNFPKQFLKINGELSLLQQTAERLMPSVAVDDIVVMTNADYRFYVKSDMDALMPAHAAGYSNTILEPAARNTAPAIALGIAYCRDILSAKGDEVIFVCPSDHIIRPKEKFMQYVSQAAVIAGMGQIVTFGVRPDRPETGYGYIKSGKAISADGIEAYSVAEFAEKPDAATAKRYVEQGFLWNSGMFAFRIDTMINELKAHAPAIGAMLDLSYEEMTTRFSELPDISIDYAVMEKSGRVAVLPLDIYWNDIGSWDSLYDILDKDADGNIAEGDVHMIDTEQCMIIGGKRLISTIGLKECLIVETPDALLIAKRGEAQKVKDVVSGLRTASRNEAIEHVTTYRPWGSYTVLEEGDRYKIKRIVVNPGAKLSLQMHYHRSEHWTVIKGTAKVTIADKQAVLHEDESIYVPKATFHRLENPGRVALEIIEVQSGEYVGEDDIVRTDDTYGRS